MEHLKPGIEQLTNALLAEYPISGKYTDKKVRLMAYEMYIKDLADSMGVKFEKVSFTPWGFYKDASESLRMSIRDRNYIRVITQSLEFILQTTGPYLYADWYEQSEKQNLRRITIKYPGLVLEPITLVSFGFPLINLVNHSAMLLFWYNFSAHELTHVYQKLVVEAMTQNGLCSNTKYACNHAAIISEKIPYRIPRKEELRFIAIETRYAVLQYERHKQAKITST